MLHLQYFQISNLSSFRVLAKLKSHLELFQRPSSKLQDHPRPTQCHLEVLQGLGKFQTFLWYNFRKKNTIFDRSKYRKFQLTAFQNEQILTSTYQDHKCKWGSVQRAGKEAKFQQLSFRPQNPGPSGTGPGIRLWERLRESFLTGRVLVGVLWSFNMYLTHI